MKRAESLLATADRWQRDRAWLAVPVATVMKFGDDKARQLGALIAYYAFGSIFPLLLVFVTILDLIIRNNTELQQKLIDTALSKYPVIGPELENHVRPLSATGIALVVGLVLTLFGGLGVAFAMQNAMNTVWAVPKFRRPKGGRAILRSLGIIALIGPGQVVTIGLSSIAGGISPIGGAVAHIGTIVVSLVLNIGLFWLAFRLSTAREVRTRDLRLGAILAAVAWQILQLVGGYFLAHEGRTNSAYGVFGIVLGLLAWLFLQAQITLYVVELDVVRVRKLWPRSLAPPPFTEADMRAYESYARTTLVKPDLEADVRQTTDDDT